MMITRPSVARRWEGPRGRPLSAEAHWRPALRPPFFPHSTHQLIHRHHIHGRSEVEEAGAWAQSKAWADFWAHHRPTWVEIDLGAVRANVREFRAKAFRPHGPAGPDLSHPSTASHSPTHSSSQSNVIAVVKADAYGHGAVLVGEAAVKAGAAKLAVATLEEGIQLRKSGRIGAGVEILLLGLSAPSTESAVLAHRLTPTVVDLDSARRFAVAAEKLGLREKAGIHLKIDTGMGRIGLLPASVRAFGLGLKDAGYDGALDAGSEEKWAGRLRLEGVMTHFAKADEAHKAHARSQVRAFEQALSELESLHFPELRLVHVANSAGAMESREIFPRPDAQAWLRLGISLYGLFPSAEVNNGEKMELRPVMAWKTRIVQIKTLPPGQGVSYGAHFTTHRPAGTTIATLPVGYADGFRRLLTYSGINQSKPWHVLLRGQRVRVVGRICMDMTMIDVSDVPGAAPGDEVVLLGRQGNEEITAEAWAGQLQTINYEVTSLLGKRVPRVFLDHHRHITAISDLLGTKYY